MRFKGGGVRGLFATQPLRRGELVLVFAGKVRARVCVYVCE
jgi:hypothetical protein